MATTSTVENLATEYRRHRERSRALFDLLTDDAYYKRPISLRHPVVFYEGHLPAFSFNTLVKRGLRRPSIDARLEDLFARGIDPPSPLRGFGRTTSIEPERAAYDPWPARSVVRAFADEADRQVLEALEREDLDRPGDPLLDRAEAAFAILEHELMHQETLLYMWHQLPHEQKLRPDSYAPVVNGRSPQSDWIDVSDGVATLGVDRDAVRFGWDNEFPRHVTQVRRFRMQRHDITNERFLEFVDAGGYTDRRWWPLHDWAWLQREKVAHPLFWSYRDGAWWWRGMFDWIPLPLSWPVYVSHAEASAFARWAGARLPTEGEFQRAAFGLSGGGERAHPWGDGEPTAAHGVFDFTSWDPQPAGSHNAGRSAWGIDDLVGNGWEWTGTPFAPFPGFQAMRSYPEYSADFFDGEHFVMKGASPATARELLRPSLRNWFRPHYPYVYATFRLVQDVDR